MLAIRNLSVIITAHWRRSSVVEQRNHNPLVRGPNPFAATINLTPILSGFDFWYLEYLGFGPRKMGSIAAKRQTEYAGSPSGEFCKIMLINPWSGYQN